MIRQIKTLIFLLILIFFSLQKLSHAAGVPSGTVITNRVTVTYSLGGQVFQTITESSFVVDNKVIVVVTSLGNATVLPNDKDQALVFSLTNAGNTPQHYKLEAGPVFSPENIEMTNIRIYLDKDNSGTLTAGDIPYSDPSSFGDIKPDETIKLLIVADIPQDVEDGKTSTYYLLATTVDAGTTNITQQSATNTAGVDVVFADSAGINDIARDGKHSASGVFTVGSATVYIEKKAEIIYDPLSTGQIKKPNPGAILRYTLTVTVTGSAVAKGVMIKDTIPDGSDYVRNTLRLNANPLTDEDDTDSGSFKDGAIEVKLGDLNKNSPRQVITFDIKLN
jgi:uncharacterized repeat protein (TIGR01451 family)